MLGDVSLQAGKVDEALDYLKKMLEIVQKLVAVDASDAEAKFLLYGSYHMIAEVQQRQKEYEQAIETYGRGLKILQSLKEQKKLAPDNERWIGVVEQLIQQCKLMPIALGDWKTLLEQPKESLPLLLNMRGTQFVHDGRVSDAVQAVSSLRKLGTATAEQLYNAACVYGLCAASIKAEKDELTAELAKQRQHHITDALATLREAIAAGWTNFAHMANDLDLVILRDLPEFKALLPKADPNEKK
jgi:tetratricopeptide (TPR) repeat protein